MVSYQISSFSVGINVKSLRRFHFSNFVVHVVAKAWVASRSSQAHHVSKKSCVMTIKHMQKAQQERLHMDPQSTLP